MISIGLLDLTFFFSWRGCGGGGVAGWQAAAGSWQHAACLSLPLLSASSHMPFSFTSLALPFPSLLAPPLILLRSRPSLPPSCLPSHSTSPCCLLPPPLILLVSLPPPRPSAKPSWSTWSGPSGWRTGWQASCSALSGSWMMQRRRLETSCGCWIWIVTEWCVHTCCLSSFIGGDGCCCWCVVVW